MKVTFSATNEMFMLRWEANFAPIPTPTQFPNGHFALEALGTGPCPLVRTPSYEQSFTSDNLVLSVF